MERVPSGFNVGNNGREHRRERMDLEDNILLKGVLKRLRHKGGTKGMAQTEGTHPYPDDLLDLPGLDVPDMKE